MARSELLFVNYTNPREERHHLSRKLPKGRGREFRVARDDEQVDTRGDEGEMQSHSLLQSTTNAISVHGFLREFFAHEDGDTRRALTTRHTLHEHSPTTRHEPARKNPIDIGRAAKAETTRKHTVSNSVNSDPRKLNRYITDNCTIISTKSKVSGDPLRGGV